MTQVAFRTHQLPQPPSAAPVLQRKCACGTQSYGNAECAECAKKHGKLQRKLAIGASNDPLEVEADRVADQVMAKSTPTDVVAAPVRIQRLRSTTADSTRVQVPAGVERVLSSTGTPLNAGLRRGMERRFGHDFSQVRIHADGIADESARAVGALAYTVGNRIAFAHGQFRPDSLSGHRLLAHELTHVVQQTGASHGTGSGRAHPVSNAENRMQRFVACEQASLSLEPCPEREWDEIAESRSDPMSVHDYAQLSDEGRSVNGFAVVGFAVDDSKLKSNLKTLPKWKQLANFIAKSNVRWNLYGVSDCSGKPDRNFGLRKARAQALYASLPEEARKKIVSIEAAPMTECITSNQRKLDRMLNRSVVIEQAGRSVDIDSSEEKPIEAKPPDFVCGPDVTEQVGKAVGIARSHFAGWTKDQREDACNALIGFRVGYCSWDIRELHNDDWINKDYQPKHCATKGAPKGQECGESVQVGSDCYYAGTPNYVIYGTMFKLCEQENPDIHFDFSRSNMRSLIDLYKGSGVSGLATPSGNFKAALAWANAGFEGWPTGGTPPTGDRNNCKPMCPAAYAGRAFDIHWYPHHVTEGCSPSIIKAVRKGKSS